MYRKPVAFIDTHPLNTLDIGTLAALAQAFGQSGRGTKSELLCRVTKHYIIHMKESR